MKWLAIPKKKPTVQQSINVVDIITNKKQGFGAMLHKIRAKKHTPNVSDDEESERAETPPKSPQDICGLIDHFKTLPKIYPKKPKKLKPKPELMMEKYAERKKEREKAMRYVTRRRIRRVEFHCNTLEELFLADG